jgi:hypothetical protein
MAEAIEAVKRGFGLIIARNDEDGFRPHPQDQEDHTCHGGGDHGYTVDDGRYRGADRGEPASTRQARPLQGTRWSTISTSMSGKAAARNAVMNDAGKTIGWWWIDGGVLRVASRNGDTRTTSLSRDNEGLARLMLTEAWARL